MCVLQVQKIFMLNKKSQVGLLVKKARKTEVITYTSEPTLLYSYIIHVCEWPSCCRVVSYSIHSFYSGVISCRDGDFSFWLWKALQEVLHFTHSFLIICPSLPSRHPFLPIPPFFPSYLPSVFPETSKGTTPRLGIRRPTSPSPSFPATHPTIHPK